MYFLLIFNNFHDTIHVRVTIQLAKLGGNIMKCPKCGNENCQVITETSTKGKDYSVGKGLCGGILLGPLGLLCGACGKGKQITSTTYWICSNCGYKFKA